MVQVGSRDSPLGGVRVIEASRVDTGPLQFISRKRDAGPRAIQKQRLLFLPPDHKIQDNNDCAAGSAHLSMLLSDFILAGLDQMYYGSACEDGFIAGCLA